MSWRNVHAHSVRSGRIIYHVPFCPDKLSQLLPDIAAPSSPLVWLLKMLSFGINSVFVFFITICEETQVSVRIWKINNFSIYRGQYCFISFRNLLLFEVLRSCVFVEVEMPNWQPLCFYCIVIPPSAGHCLLLHHKIPLDMRPRHRNSHNYSKPTLSVSVLKYQHMVFHKIHYLEYIKQTVYLYCRY